jgi:hypothetical protein
MTEIRPTLESFFLKLTGPSSTSNPGGTAKEQG